MTKYSNTVHLLNRHPKFSELGMRLFGKYVLQNRFDALFGILARFEQATGVPFSEQNRRRRMHKLKELG